jgi:uncharacterized protein
MPLERAIKFGIGEVTLGSSTIQADWILEGNPVAHSCFLSESADKTATTWMWDCSAGRFNWYYDGDETIYVIEGKVTVRDHGGVTRSLNAGDTAFFPAGSSAEWTVDKYVRKIAFLRQPLEQRSFAKRLYHFLKRAAGSSTTGNHLPEMTPTL